MVRFDHLLIIHTAPAEHYSTFLFTNTAAWLKQTPPVAGYRPEILSATSLSLPTACSAPTKINSYVEEQREHEVHWQLIIPATVWALKLLLNIQYTKLGTRYKRSLQGCPTLAEFGRITELEIMRIWEGHLVPWLSEYPHECLCNGIKVLREWRLVSYSVYFFLHLSAIPNCLKNYV